MRTLMIEPDARRKPSASHGERQADDVVSVQEVVRGCAEVELGEDAGRQRELDPVTRTAAIPSTQSEGVANSDGRDFEFSVREVVAGFVPQEACEGS